MQLDAAQRTTLRNDIQNSTDPAVIAARGNGADIGRDDTTLAAIYNAPSSKVVWRTDVARADIYHQTSVAALAGGTPTTWNWTTYKSQNVSEQNAWVQMFMGDLADFSLANLRAGVDAIFSGSGAPAAQRAHVAAIAKRYATRAEALYTTGDGSVATPATLGPQGALTPSDIGAAFQG